MNIRRYLTRKKLADPCCDFPIGNTAVGFAALYSNTTPFRNTAVGWAALSNNTTGDRNTATGFQALEISTGDRNAAYGSSALAFNTSGHDNTASGTWALFSNITGSFNIAVGSNAGFNLTTGDNNIDIGDNNDVAGEANTIRVGIEGTQTATFIAGIANAMVTGSAVYIDTTSGRLGLVSSSESGSKMDRIDGQRERSGPFAATCYLPLQKERRPERRAAVWPCR
jgi:hypothetical protein